jgi:solute carrier family 40 (iron-regulated transporter), member 1
VFDFPEVVQRLVVAASCVLFFLSMNHLRPSHEVRIGVLVLLTFFACLEKLSAIMNMVAVEKDWVGAFVPN